MPTLKLTKTAVEGATPGPKDQYLWDTQLPRFGVRITPEGAKQADGTPRPARRIYLVQYRAKPESGQANKFRRITIGQHGKPWTVDQARDEARKLLAQVDLKRDPFADREEERRARQVAQEAAEQAAELQARAAELRNRNSFTAVTDRYIDLKAKTNRSWTETERLLRFGQAKPADPVKRRSGRPHASDTIGPMTVWADRHISEIRRADVADLMDAISQRSPAVARATYAALRGLFAWCMERDLIETSPCDGFKAPPRPKARERVMADDELRLIWRASGDLGEPFGPIVKLLMLTGQRRAEVAGMAWAELELDAQTWRIPGERTKNGKAHELDLCGQAVEILKGLTRTGPLVFPARGEGAARGFSATKRRLDDLVEALRAKEAAEAGVELEEAAPWRLHDLRRTAATGMAALNFPPHVVERVLNHVSNTQSGLVGVYQRHEYRQERKAASLAWGAHVAAVIAGEAPAPASNVIPIRA